MAAPEPLFRSPTPQSPLSSVPPSRTQSPSPPQPQPRHSNLIQPTLVNCSADFIDKQWEGGEWIRQPLHFEPYSTDSLRALLANPAGIHPATDTLFGIFPPAKIFRNGCKPPSDLAAYVQPGPCIVYFVDTSVKHQTFLRGIHKRLKAPPVSTDTELEAYGYDRIPPGYRVYNYSYTHHTVVLDGSNYSRADVCRLAKDRGIRAEPMYEELQDSLMGSEEEQIRLRKAAFEACYTGQGIRGSRRCIPFGNIREQGKEFVQPPANVRTDAEFARRSAAITQNASLLASIVADEMYGTEAPLFRDWNLATNALTFGSAQKDGLDKDSFVRNNSFTSGQVNYSDAVLRTATSQEAAATMSETMAFNGDVHVDIQDAEGHLTAAIHMSNIDTSHPDPSQRGSCGYMLYLANGSYTENEPGGIAFLSGLAPHVSTAARLPAGVTPETEMVRNKRTNVICYPNSKIINGEASTKFGHMRPRPAGAAEDIFYVRTGLANSELDASPKGRTGATTFLRYGANVLGGAPGLLQFVSDQMHAFLYELHVCNQLSQVPLSDGSGDIMQFLLPDPAKWAECFKATLHHRNGEVSHLSATPRTIDPGSERFRELVAWFEDRKRRHALFLSSIRKDLQDALIDEVVLAMLDELAPQKAKKNAKRKAEDDLSQQPARRPRVEEPDLDYASLADLASYAHPGKPLRVQTLNPDGTNDEPEDTGGDTEPEDTDTPATASPGSGTTAQAHVPNLSFLDFPVLEATFQHLSSATAGAPRRLVSRADIRSFDATISQALHPLVYFDEDNAVGALRSANQILNKPPAALKLLHLQIDCVHSRLLLLSAALFQTLFVQLGQQAMDAYAGREGVSPWMEKLVADILFQYDTEAKQPTELELDRYFPGLELGIFTLLPAPTKIRKRPGVTNKAQPLALRVLDDVVLILAYAAGFPGAPSQNHPACDVPVSFFAGLARSAFAWLLYRRHGAPILALASVQRIWNSLPLELFGDRRFRIQILPSMDKFDALLAAHPSSRKGTAEQTKLAEILDTIRQLSEGSFEFGPLHHIPKSANPPFFGDEVLPVTRSGHKKKKPVVAIIQPPVTEVAAVAERVELLGRFILDMTLQLHKFSRPGEEPQTVYLRKCLRPDWANSARRTPWKDRSDVTNDGTIFIRERGMTMRLLSNRNGPCSSTHVRTAEGFFSLLVLRIVTFGCIRFIQGHHFGALCPPKPIPPDGWDNIFHSVEEVEQHLAAADAVGIGFLDKSVYGVPCSQRGDKLETLWIKAQAWAAHIENQETLQWSNTLHWLRKKPHAMGMGKLISMLVLEDLVWMGKIVQEPSSKEMGDALVQNGYGAAKALVKFGLPATTDTFERLFKATTTLRQSKNSILGDPSDLTRYPFHVGNLEHVLCKISKFGLINTELLSMYADGRYEHLWDTYTGYEEEEEDDIDGGL